MDGKLLTLPIGIQSFDKLRQGNYLYVDKTKRLQELATSSPWCFLSRPRRFGKSLTLSTLDAMFSGKVEVIPLFFISIFYIFLDTSLLKIDSPGSGEPVYEQ